MPPRRLLLNLWLLAALSACMPVAAAVAPAPLPGASATPTPFRPLDETPTPFEEPAPSPEPPPTATSTASPAPLPTAASLPAELEFDPADWHNWPVLPVVTQRARLIYVFGQSQGNDPHAFSVLGDCQSEPEAFMGLFETDADLRAALPPELQETVAWFAGSFNRDAPTIRGGTTTGALLWSAWHQNAYTCTIYETPLACELRIHKPSYVIVHVGTHYENNNDLYMRMVLDELIAAGSLPILASKGDNREVDEAVNRAYAALAVEYDIPFWNFWAMLVDLENRGLYTRPDVPLQGDLYLTAEALAIHRLTALQALDAVWRAVSAP